MLANDNASVLPRAETIKVQILKLNQWNWDHEHCHEHCTEHCGGIAKTFAKGGRCFARSGNKKGGPKAAYLVNRRGTIGLGALRTACGQRNAEAATENQNAANDRTGAQTASRCDGRCGRRIRAGTAKQQSPDRLFSRAALALRPSSRNANTPAIVEHRARNVEDLRSGIADDLDSASFRNPAARTAATLGSADCASFHR